MIADLRDREELTALGASVPAVASAAVASVESETTEAHVLGTRRRGGRTLSLGARRLGEDARRELLADRYELQAEVGSGGTGIVYRALDHAIYEIIAVKMLRAELLAADPLARERLTHELRLARRISHRHVVRIQDRKRG